MVCRELRLPAGVSVLHVEQEVTGDNTLALDSIVYSSVTLRECSCSLERGSYCMASGDKNTAAGRSVY